MFPASSATAPAGQRAGWPRARPATTRARGAGALSVVALLALAACGSAEAEEPVASGGAERSLTVYNGRSAELVGPLLEQFTQDTGITIELRSASSGELAAQLLTEQEATPADVFLSQDAGALGALTRAGMLAELPDEVLDRVDPAFRAQDGSWLGLSGRVRVVTYNEELVEDAPDTIDEVVDGSFAEGRIGYAPSNASWQSFVTGLRVLRGEDGARQWLEQLAAQDPVAFEGNAQVRDAVDAGQVQVGLVNHYYLSELLDEKGADAVKARNQFMAPGDPGGLVNVAGVGILESADDADEAQALVDYLSSPKAQEYFATQTSEYPLLAGVAQPRDLPSLAELEAPKLDLSDLASIAETQALLADVGLLTT